MDPSLALCYRYSDEGTQVDSLVWIDHEYYEIKGYNENGKKVPMPGLAYLDIYCSAFTDFTSVVMGNIDAVTNLAPTGWTLSDMQVKSVMPPTFTDNLGVRDYYNFRYLLGNVEYAEKEYIDSKEWTKDTDLYHSVVLFGDHDFSLMCLLALHKTNTGGNAVIRVTERDFVDRMYLMSQCFQAVTYLKPVSSDCIYLVCKGRLLSSNEDRVRDILEQGNTDSSVYTDIRIFLEQTLMQEDYNMNKFLKIWNMPD